MAFSPVREKRHGGTSKDKTRISLLFPELCADRVSCDPKRGPPQRLWSCWAENAERSRSWSHPCAVVFCELRWNPVSFIIGKSGGKKAKIDRSWIRIIATYITCCFGYQMLATQQKKNCDVGPPWMCLLQFVKHPEHIRHGRRYAEGICVVRWPALLLRRFCVCPGDISETVQTVACNARSRCFWTVRPVLGADEEREHQKENDGGDDPDNFQTLPRLLLPFPVRTFPTFDPHTHGVDTVTQRSDELPSRLDAALERLYAILLILKLAK